MQPPMAHGDFVLAFHGRVHPISRSHFFGASNKRAACLFKRFFYTSSQARLWACGRGDVSKPSFGSHLNPISTRGGRLCPPYTGVHTKFWKPQVRLKYTINTNFCSCQFLSGFEWILIMDFWYFGKNYQWKSNLALNYFKFKPLYLHNWCKKL